MKGADYVAVCPIEGWHSVRVVLMVVMMWWLCGYEIVGRYGGCGGCVGDGYDEGDGICGEVCPIKG